MHFCREKKILRQKEITREFGISQKKMTMVKSKLIKKQKKL